MKKNLVIAFLLLLISGIGYAQLTGVKTIPGDYSTVAAAISDLNTSGAGSGGVTFNIAAGYTETFVNLTDGTITTTTGSASNPIVFQKSGAGANPAITAAVATSGATDGIFKFAGTDYVTFDGINVQENPANTTNKTEWGYAILMASATDASQYINIRNCNITLDKTNANSVGIYSSNHGATSTTAIVPTDPTGAVSYCNIDNCNISNVYIGIQFKGYNASAPYSLYGQMNHFGQTTGNTITNFGGGSAITYGLYTIYQNDVVAAHNTVNGGAGSTNTVGGIYISTANNANADIYSNTVTLSNSGTGTGATYAIFNQGSSVSTTNTVNIYGNVVENCSQVNATNGNWYMINNMAKAVTTNIYDNIVRNNSKPESGGSVYMFYLSATGTGTENIYHNQVFGNSVTLGGTSVFYAFYCNSSATSKNIYSNLIHDNTVSSSSMYGIYTALGTDVAVYQNSIYGQRATTSGPILNYGVRINSGTNVYLYNNLVSDLTANASSSSFALRGISVDAGTNAGLYYNSVFLNGTSSGVNFGSACVYASTTPNLEMKNNILANTSVPNGTGNTIAYWRSNTVLNTYAATSGNNCFYAGTPGPQNLIFYDGTNAFQSIANYKILVSPADGSSFSEMPPFVNSTVTPYDLHLNVAVPTQCESGASTVSSPVNVTVDYDDVPRYPNTGYPNNAAHPASAPDVGAFEFAGISVDLSSPSISYTLLPNTSLTTNRTLTATISDASGVPVSGSGLPVCYWKINAGAYMSAQGVHGAGDEYTFVFGSGTVLGDVVSYYIMAQDEVTPPNVGANPTSGASGFSADPPSCTTPPSSPNTYEIISSISGNVTVGTGGTYPSLTGPGGLFEDINSKVLTGNLVATIISDLTEDGTNALARCIEDGIGNYTITIKPDAATERLIEGNVAFPMIRFYGAQRATIDGRYNGSGKYLRFRNTNTSSADFEFWNDASNDTVRDCIWESANTSTATGQAGVIRISITSGPNGNDNNVIMNNVVRDLTSGSGQPSRGIFALGISSAYNSYNTISGNEVMNFRDYGIYISTYNDHVTVTGNSLFNDLATPPTTTINCIYFVSGAGGEGNVISGNYIGGTAPMCGGTPWLMNTTGGLTGIFLSVGSVEATEVYSNYFSNIQSILTTGAGSYYGINLASAGFFHIGSLGGNIIGSTTTPNSILFDGTNAFRGIYNTNQNSENTIENNVVANISWSKATGTSSSIYGIVNNRGNVRNNKVYNIGSQQADFVPTIYGLYDNGSTGNTNVYSNNIVDLDGGAATNPVLYAFHASAATSTNTNLYFNTFYIHGPATGTSPTSAFKRTVGSNLTMKNNIFFNDRASGGSGSHYAVWDNVSGTMISDYNNLYSAAGPLGYFGGSDITSMSSWQSVTAGDAHSESVNPNFASATDLHPSNTALNGLGTDIPGITTDFDGVTRTSPPDAGAYEWSVTVTDYHTLPATLITSTGAQLNGDLNTRGEMVETYFDWGTTTAYGNTVAVDGYGTPPGVRNNALTPVSAAITGLEPNTTYHFRLHGIPVSSSQPDFYGEDLMFTAESIPSTVVTLPATNIVDADATLNGTVDANNSTANVTFEWGLTTSYGNTAVASPATVTGNTATPVSAVITGLAPATIYHFRCVGAGIGGTGYGEDMMFTSDCPIPASAGTITGPTSLCQGTTGNVYSIDAVTFASGYVWTVPTGGTIVAGDGSNSITVDYSNSAVSGDVTVMGTNVCGNGSSSTLAVTINPIPVPTITGPDVACVSASSSYSTESGMSGYVWTVSAGGTITAGAGTHTVTIEWNTTGNKTVTVTYSSPLGCAAAAPASMSVLVDSRPSPTIAGPNMICANSDSYVYSTEAGNSNYVWGLSGGGTIVSGQGTYQIEVVWNMPGDRTVSVNYENASGCSAYNATTFAVTVEGTPGSAGQISGTDELCAGSTGVEYSVNPIPNATGYVWTVPSGATIVAGDNTNQITVDFSLGAISGDISVTGFNSCGSGQVSPAYTVTVNPVPETPVITLDGDVLSSSAALGNQWYLNGVAIAGATEQTYVFTEEGDYTVIVTVNGCSSDVSNTIVISFTGIEDIDAGVISVYPNPNQGAFRMNIDLEGTARYDMLIVNNIGAIVYQEKDLVVDGNFDKYFDIQGLKAGVYSIVLTSDNRQVIRKKIICTSRIN